MITTPTPNNSPQIDRLFPAGIASVPISKAAARLGISEDQVAALIDSGQLIAVAIGDAPRQKRVHYRLEVFSIEGWWLEQLASNGCEPNYPESASCTWWRGELRKQRAALKISPHRIGQ